MEWSLPAGRAALVGQPGGLRQRSGGASGQTLRCKKRAGMLP